MTDSTAWHLEAATRVCWPSWWNTPLTNAWEEGTDRGREGREELLLSSIKKGLINVDLQCSGGYGTRYYEIVVHS